MAVTVHNATFTAGPTSANSRGLLHTTTAGSSLLVWIHSNEATTFSSCVAGGNSLTKLTAVSAGTSRMELWAMTAAPAGTLTISAAVTGNNPATWCMVATSYVGQRNIGGAPFGTIVVGTAVAATANLSVSSTTTDMVAFGFGMSANTTTTINGTTDASATHSTTGRLVIGHISGSATVSVSAAAGAGTPQWGGIAIPIVASATPATTLAFDNAAVTGTSGAVNTFSLLLTATTNATLIVFLNTSIQVGGQTVSAVNVGANQLSLLGFVDYHGDAVRTQVWGLTSAPSGVLTISVAAVGANTFALNIAAATYVGHKTGVGGPFGGVNVTSATGALSTAITGSATTGNLVVYGFGNWMFDPVSFSVDTAALNLRSAPLQFPAVLVADSIGGPVMTASAQASSAVDWGCVALNLIQSGSPSFVTAVFSATDAQDSFAAPGYVLVQGSFVATDTADKFTAIAAVRISAGFAATDAPDLFSATAIVTSPAATAAWNYSGSLMGCGR